MPLTGDAGILVQIPQRPQPEDIPPALPAMFGRIVYHVAALAECSQVSRSAVSRIMVKVRACKHDIGHPHTRERKAGLHRNTLALVRSPAGRISVPPASIAKMCDPPKVWPTALLAASARTLEPDRA